MDALIFTKRLAPPFPSRNESREKKADTSHQPRRSRCRWYCHEPSCLKSFTRRSDLKRHQKSVHNPQVYLCGCCQNERRESTFSRPDKVKEHQRNSHGHYPSSLLRCGMQFCDGKSSKCGLLFCGENCLDQHHRQSHRSQNDIDSTPGTERSPLDSPNSKFLHLSI